MKKILLSISLLIALGGCQQNSNTDVQSASENITYFKDSQTGLCFAAVNSTTYGGWNVVSITCVPCDSLKNVLK